MVHYYYDEDEEFEDVDGESLSFSLTDVAAIVVILTIFMPYLSLFGVLDISGLTMISEYGVTFVSENVIDSISDPSSVLEFNILNALVFRLLFYFSPIVFAALATITLIKRRRGKSSKTQAVLSLAYSLVVVITMLIYDYNLGILAELMAFKKQLGIGFWIAIIGGLFYFKE